MGDSIPTIQLRRWQDQEPPRDAMLADYTWEAQPPFPIRPRATTQTGTPTIMSGEHRMMYIAERTRGRPNKLIVNALGERVNSLLNREADWFVYDSADRIYRLTGRFQYRVGYRRFYGF